MLLSHYHFSCEVFLLNISYLRVVTGVLSVTHAPLMSRFPLHVWSFFASPLTLNFISQKIHHAPLREPLKCSMNLVVILPGINTLHPYLRGMFIFLSLCVLDQAQAQSETCPSLSEKLMYSQLFATFSPFVQCFLCDGLHHLCLSLSLIDYRFFEGTDGLFQSIC